MYDLARSQHFVEAHWRRILPLLAELGYTDVGVYIETAVHLPEMPLHRPFGGLSYANAKLINRLCAENGLGVHWFTNTLGHCGILLRNDHFRHLAETEDVLFQLCPSHPETRGVLSTLIAGFAALDPGEWLHVGGDEAYHLNHCARCRARGMSRGELYQDHFAWVITEVKKYGKRAALWGDMILHHPEIADGIDRDTLIFDWQYQRGTAESIRFFQEHGFEVIPCTASVDYAHFHPFPGIVDEGVAPFMRAARKTGAGHMCHAVWEMYHGAAWDNQWINVAAAPALFDKDMFLPAEFAAQFYGSVDADVMRLRELVDHAGIERVVRVRGGTGRSVDLRQEFLGQTNPLTVYYRYAGGLDGVQATPAELAAAGARNERARSVATEIQQAARRRQECLRFLTLPYDIFKAICDRVAVLCRVRDTSVRLHPHSLPDDAGTKLLAATADDLREHIAFCHGLVELLQCAADEAGHPPADAANLRRQLAGLEELLGYIEHHRDTYAGGEPVPERKLWFV